PPVPSRLFSPTRPPTRASSLSLHDALPIYHERGVRRRRDPARREVGDRELPGPRHPPHQLVGRAEVLRLGHQLLGRERREAENLDRKSTRLNSSHVAISYAVFCLKKKKQLR